MKAVNINNKKYFAEIVEKKIWIKSDDQVWSYEIAELLSKKTGSKGAGANPFQIIAPMPGKITKIFVAPNDQVVRGQALLVMEAMKMEYTLKSDVETKVESVFVQTGEQVVLGKILVQLLKQDDTNR